MFAMMALPSEKSMSRDICFWKQAILCSIVLAREHFAHVRFAGGIADHAGAAAEQRNRHMAGPLHVRHNHDLHEMADMQAVRRGVKADVERDLVRC